VKESSAKKRVAEKPEPRRVALVRAYKASSELNNALAEMGSNDPEATILLKRALSQVQTALNYLR
jgi:hypothetical protein